MADLANMADAINPADAINEVDTLAVATIPEEARHQYALVASAISYIRANALRQPSLEEVAAFVGMSDFHFQRVFTQWAGVSPKRFLQYLTKEHALAALRESADVLRAALDVGLSAPSRLHDLIVSCEAMTPGEVRALGASVEIGYGVAPTPFGDALLGWTGRGVCHLTFCDEATQADETIGASQLALQALRAAWPLAHLEQDDAQAQALAQRMFPTTPVPGKLHLVLRGTNFQIKVWEALMRIEPGRIVSYTQLAAMAGAPKAQRAVGSAMAANTIGYLIPCHRVIRESGEIGHYRWGPQRKAALLAWEAARKAAS